MRNTKDCNHVLPLEKCSAPYWEAVQRAPVLQWIADYHTSRLESKMTGALNPKSPGVSTSRKRTTRSSSKKTPSQPPSQVPDGPAPSKAQKHRADSSPNSSGKYQCKGCSKAFVRLEKCNTHMQDKHSTMAFEPYVGEAQPPGKSDGGRCT